MSPLMLYNGSLLLVDGKLASHPSCCCGGACCIPEGCYAEVTALFVDLDFDTGLIFCPSAPPPPPPGYALFESHCEGDTRVSTFRKTLDPNSCENPDPEETGTIETMEQYFIQVSQLPGPPGKFDGGGEVFVYPTGGCQDGLTQAACESQGGTFYAGKTCADNPCLYDCDINCNKTITVNWSNNGASGKLTYTIADRGTFVQLPGLRVSSSINCQNEVDGKWSISVVFCAVAPYGGGWAAARISALADGCPPDGPVTWTTQYLNPVADASASIS